MSKLISTYETPPLLRMGVRGTSISFCLRVSLGWVHFGINLNLPLQFILLVGLQRSLKMVATLKREIWIFPWDVSGKEEENKEDQGSMLYFQWGWF